jgi:hypothetical protein
LTYYLRAGVALGIREWNEWLHAEVERSGADLLVIDTASTCNGFDVNDNSAVAAFYRDALRPAASAGAAVLLLHHERKTGQFGRGSASQAMMGARQWAGQADAHLALEAPGALIDEPAKDNRTRQRYAITLELLKLRDGLPDVPTKLVLASERDAAGLVWMRLDGEHGTHTVTLADRAVSVLAEHAQPMARGDLATELNIASDNRSLDRAFGDERIVKVSHGHYALREPNRQIAISPV